MARLNTHNLRVEFDNQTYNFYTDFELLSEIENAEKAQYTQNDGKLRTAKTTQRNILKSVYYLFYPEMNDLKLNVERAAITDIYLNEMNPTESPTVEVSALPEGLYKCIVSFTILNFVNYA